MPSKYTTTKSLVIVESPAKCKKIEEYLGGGYKCMASFGHLRELSSLQNIDIKNNFACNYTIIDNSIKKKQIELLRKAIQNTDEVILATDDDREGEAIAWHICQLFDLNVNTTSRIVFHEITESALQKAIHSPRKVDMNIVYAQQTRQILDLLVGFRISPILWKCISSQSAKALSAGRCQTPALKIIYENYLDIQQLQEKKVYNTTGYFTNLHIPFELNKQFDTSEEVEDFLDNSCDHPHMYTVTAPREVIKSAPEPFTTSRLQQIASNELHISPKETMKICQKLYESGYITYMRTDSKKYSKDFINSTKQYIVKNYEEKYLNETLHLLTVGENETSTRLDNPKQKKSKATTNQKEEITAHEAIRPTNISLFELPLDLENKEKKMYKIIWENTLESCMASAKFFSIKAEISAYSNLTYQYTSEQIHFPGWQIVKNKFEKESKDYTYLQTIKQKETIPYKKMISKVTMKNTKQHYTEARLVHLLEEKGIGRPSTFSMLVDKIQERGYVKKEDIKGKAITCHDYELENDEIFEIKSKREFGNEKGKLVIQSLGIIVMDFLEKHFGTLFQYDYTKEMEEELDKISQGSETGTTLCHICNEQISHYIENIGELKKKEYVIDETHSYVIGKYGPVIKCTEQENNTEKVTFKPAKKELDIHELESGNYSLEEVVERNEKKVTELILGKYENESVVLKKGKFGLYVTWGKNSKTLKELGNRPIESISLQEVEPFLEEGSNIMREVNDNITIRKSKKGNYIFFKTPKMKKAQFFDLQKFPENCVTCELHVLTTWIRDTYHIY